MMSRGLTKEQSQELLVNGYIASVLSNFDDVREKDVAHIYAQLV